MPISELAKHEQLVMQSCKCPRLVAWREKVAGEKKREFRDWEYWGKPVPAFGDESARLLVIGLAPAAHGGNRTGRMFTGDSSGDWLYRALYKAGFANQPTSTHRDDGLKLSDCLITAAVRCAPPDNKPTAEELANCGPYLDREIEIVRSIQVVVTLGQIAWSAYLASASRLGQRVPRPMPSFRHLQVVNEGLPHVLIGSYHPSRQNTNTGKLTEPMFDAVFREARKRLSSGSDE